MEIQQEPKILSDRLPVFQMTLESAPSDNLKLSQCERDHRQAPTAHSRPNNGQIQSETPTFEHYKSESQITDNKGLETHSAKKVEPETNSADLHLRTISQCHGRPLDGRNQLVDGDVHAANPEKTPETAFSSQLSQSESNMGTSGPEGPQPGPEANGFGPNGPGLGNELPFITFPELMEAISQGLIQWKDISFHSKIVNSAFERHNQEFC